MNIRDSLKKKKGDIPIWVWLVFSLIPVFFFSIYTFNDVIETTEDGLAVCADRWRDSYLEMIYCTAVFALCIVMLAGSTYNPFIYFRF